MVDIRISSKELQRAITAANPNNVRQYLLSQGWTYLTAWGSKGAVWLTPDSKEIFVPTDNQVDHYSNVLTRVLEGFVTANIEFDDVLTMASTYVADIVRRKIDEPMTRSGSCSLQEASSNYLGLRELLRASARQFALKMGQQKSLVQDYVDQCRAGQTTIGSYVLKVYAPILVRGTIRENQEFGRQATLATAENLQFLGDEEIDQNQALPPMLDANVVEAVLKMRSQLGMLDNAGSNMSIRFVRSSFITEKESLPLSEVIDIPMTSLIFSRAEYISETFKQRDQYRKMQLYGHITDLHKNAPNAKVQERRITIRVSYDGRDRNLQVRLIPEDYRKAVIWHDTDTLVRVDVAVDTRAKFWSVREYFSIGAVEPKKDPVPDSLFPRPAPN